MAIRARDSEEMWTGPGPRLPQQHARGADSHFALVCFLEPLAKPDQAALLQWGQVTQVSLDVVCVQFVWNRSHTTSFTKAHRTRKYSRALLSEADMVQSQNSVTLQGPQIETGHHRTPQRQPLA